MIIRRFLLVCYLAWIGTAQAKTTSQIQGLLQQTVNTTNAPSLSVAVGLDNQLIHAVAVGMADEEQEVAATTETQYRTGSVAKVIGTTAFLTLLDDKKISVDDKIREYLPYLPTSYKDITLEHLLTHTSGIRHYRFGEYGTNIHYPTLEHATRVFRDSELEFSPGTGYQYTTYGINLIQGVIEKVSGQPLEPFLHRTLFSKAGMTHTEPEVAGRKRPTYATGYRSYFDRPVAEVDVSNKYIGGGMRSTPSDLIRLISAINKDILFSPKTKKTMISVPFPKQAPERALGWRVYQYKGYKGIGHSGAVNGFESFLVHLFEPNLTVAVMVNRDDYDHTSSTLYQVMDMFLPAEATGDRKQPAAN